MHGAVSATMRESAIQSVHQERVDCIAIHVQNLTTSLKLFWDRGLL